MEIKDKIKSLRVSKGLTQKDVGSKIGVSVVTIQNWENGVKTPSTNAIISICQLFNVSSDELLGIKVSECNNILAFSKEEMKLVETYRGLDRFGRMAVNSICKVENARSECAKTERERPVRLLRKYYTPAAAGYSVPIDGEDYEMIPADDAPYNADFAVGIQGNSMSPIIEDGDVVYVSSNVELRNGDIGIFCVDGAMYCKQLYADDKGNVTLVSANPDLRHTNVFIGADYGSTLTVYGKVLTGYRTELPDYIFES